MTTKENTREVISGKYYSNILVISRKRAPLTTVSQSRADWYLERDLAEYVDEEERKISYPQYEKVIRLKFKAKLENHQDEFFQQIIETRCVVCGSEEKLSLHHVVPSVIRKHFPDEHKNHAHGWCVLVCKKHHDIADALAQELHGHEIKALDQKIREKQKQMKNEWAEDFIKRNGGVEALKNKYREKFKQLNAEFLPEGFLEDHHRKPIEESP